MYCSNCGSVIPDNATYCTNCNYVFEYANGSNMQQNFSGNNIPNRVMQGNVMPQYNLQQKNNATYLETNKNKTNISIRNKLAFVVVCLCLITLFSNFGVGESWNADITEAFSFEEISNCIASYDENESFFEKLMVFFVDVSYEAFICLMIMMIISIFVNIVKYNKICILVNIISAISLIYGAFSDTSIDEYKIGAGLVFYIVTLFVSICASKREHYKEYRGSANYVSKYDVNNERYWYCRRCSAQNHEDSGVCKSCGSVKP